jgi:hypothetical protein
MDMNAINERGATAMCPRNVGARTCAHWGIALLIAAYSVVSAPQLLAAERAHTTESESGHYHRNVAELLLGTTYEDTRYGSKNGFTIGFTYERRLSDVLGLGGFWEYAAGDFDKWSIGVPLFVHPYGGWRLGLAPGVEHREGENEFLFRAGVAYEFELSERWAMIPEVNVDFVDGEEAFVFGLSLGFGF